MIVLTYIVHEVVQRAIAHQLVWFIQSNSFYSFMRKPMKRTKTTTEINKEQSLQLTSVTGLHDLSDAESQTIQGGGGLLLPALIRDTKRPY